MRIVVKREQAKRDIEECFVFIAEDELDIAINFLVRAEETFDLLAEMPFLGSLKEFRSQKLRNLRTWHVKGFDDYLIFYRPTENGVEVFRVLHAKRDIASIFDE